jgi:DNA-binding IclR family transcriptional regulator
VQSLRRGLTVLVELSRHGAPARLAEIADMVGLHRSTVHRMLVELVDAGLVAQDADHHYVIGLGAVEVARAAQASAGAGNPVHEAIADLHVATQARAIYAVPQFRHLTCVVASDRGEVTFPIVPVYAQLPLHCTAAGKAYLAFRGDAEIERYLRSGNLSEGTERARRAAPDLRRALTHVRERGFATEDREFSVRGRAVAVPVLDGRGHAAASVAVGLPARRSSASGMRDVAARAQEAARRIAVALFGLT